MVGTGAAGRPDHESSLAQQIEWLRNERDDALRAAAEIIAGYERLHRQLGTESTTCRPETNPSFLQRLLRHPRSAGSKAASTAQAMDAGHPIILPVRLQAQELRIRELGDRSVWVTALSADGAATHYLEYTTQDGESPSTVHALRLRAGHPVRLESAKGAISFRRHRGELYLVRVETRASAENDAGMSSVEKARPRHTLWRAQEMARDRPPAEALIFARATAGDSTEKLAIHLLEANAFVDDDQLWLESVNRYLAPLGIAPLELTSALGSSRFERLCTRRVPDIDRGPLVSVLMPVFNAERTLAMAVQSILGQTWRPLELILIDDASSDGSAALMRELGQGDSRIRLLRNTVNVGPYVSKNRALGIAAGKYVTVHDADDWAHPQRIENQVGVMERSDGVLVAHMARMVHMDDEGRFNGMTMQGQSSVDGAMRDAPMTCFFETAFMRRQLGYWDSVRFAADGELIERVQCVAGERFRRLQMFALMYRACEGSLTHDPAHGISRDRGLSPIRRFYRDQWRIWHRQMANTGSYMTFPPSTRLFPAPDDMVVAPADIAAAIGSVQNEQQ
jgi:hypothetical protein